MSVRHRDDPHTHLVLSIDQQVRKATKNELPVLLVVSRVRRILEHYEAQTDEEPTAEPEEPSEPEPAADEAAADEPEPAADEAPADEPDLPAGCTGPAGPGSAGVNRRTVRVLQSSSNTPETAGPHSGDKCASRPPRRDGQ